MTDTCGLTSCEPFAKWDHDSQSWKTSEVTSLWALTLSSLTLPAWGGLHDGELCEHPTPELHTSGRDYSSLPTPTVDDASNLTRASGCYNSLTRTATMLPTPRAQDEYERRNMKTMERIRDEGGDMTLPTWAKVVAPLLPTPRASISDEDTETFLARRERIQESPTRNGGPTGMPLGVAVALLPTPNCMDSMGTRSDEALARAKKNGGCANLKDVIPRLLPTPTSQAAKHGETPDTTASGYGSNLWDLPSLLPTPTSRDHKGANQRGDSSCLHGAITGQPSPDGKASSDDPHQHQLSLDELALPA